MTSNFGILELEVFPDLKIDKGRVEIGKKIKITFTNLSFGRK